MIGPAKDAGILVTDTLVDLEGQRIDTNFDTMKILSSKKPGDKVTVKVRRDDREVIFTPTLAAR